MDETMDYTIRKPIRRRKSRAQIFKETTLPSLILLAALIVILLLIIGACSRNAQTVAALTEVL